MQRKAVSSLPENDEMQNPNTGCIHFCDTASSTSYLEIQTTSSAQPPPPPPWVPYFPRSQPRPSPRTGVWWFRASVVEVPQKGAKNSICFTRVCAQWQLPTQWLFVWGREVTVLWRVQGPAHLATFSDPHSIPLMSLGSGPCWVLVAPAACREEGCRRRGLEVLEVPRDHRPPHALTI